jgi:stearoyl-CoA desaturase (delta-9 desaturase)
VALALLSLSESWHNMHHSDPACARHGSDPRQIDVSAAVIRIFEHLGWATSVHWPVPAAWTAAAAISTSPGRRYGSTARRRSRRHPG